MFRTFERFGVEYVLIGATAMGFYDVIRATRDVDMILQASPENLERLRTALRDLYPDDENIEQIRDDDLLGDYPAVRYFPPGDGLFFDLMTRLGEAANYESLASEWREIDGIRVRVATARALYRLKKDTLRPLDRQDAAMLAQRFGFKDGDE
ncbi:MAG: hypothetical protein ABIS67_13245 [Candidatus Eisenbacteria bacterium]